MAFTPALLSGFGTDKRYQGATLGFVDVNEEVLEMVAKFARRTSDELGMDWKIEASTDRKEVLPEADIVTTSIGVGGLDAWVLDVDVPYQYGFFQPVGRYFRPGRFGHGRCGISRCWWGLGKIWKHCAQMVSCTISPTL